MGREKRRFGGLEASKSSTAGTGIASARLPQLESALQPSTKQQLSSGPSNHPGHAGHPGSGAQAGASSPSRRDCAAATALSMNPGRPVVSARSSARAQPDDSEVKKSVPQSSVSRDSDKR